MESEIELDDAHDTNIESGGHNTSREGGSHIIPLVEEEWQQGTTDNGSQVNRNTKNLSNDERNVVYQMFLKKSVNGVIKKTTSRKVATFFSISMRTVQRIWKRGNESEIGDVSNKRKNCGRKKKEVDVDKFRALELKKRTTLESAACSLGMSRTSLFRRLEEGIIRRHSNAIKPYLKEQNKISRLLFCLCMLEEHSITHNPVFESMFNVIHIDEKWFYMTKREENYYLLPDEEEPVRTCKSKNFIGKVMFLVAVAHPRFDVHGNVTFSGKIGVFPFVKREAVVRSSVNRIAATMETKPMNSVKREDMKSFLIEKVIPAIKEKRPTEDNRHPIYIQQDNARTHVDPNDYEFCQATKEDGFDIRLTCQPPNSPDLNVLDLGFFCAIQSLQEKESTTTVDELMNAVVKSFEEFSVVKSNRIFLTLQQCMIEIMKVKGGHDYRMQHINKAKLEREGKLPMQLQCDASLVEDVIQYLS